ncbi:MAG: RagB/SusD family nutrient uptake outer membrane protein, partial [Chitinophagaceae bacterium]|nr:RagB/SusD family nutrient uptake outer membrane protein [Chitinophagaceae bacterium]
MKNKIYFALLASLFMDSCQKLDREFITDVSQEQIEASFDRTAQLLNAVYVELREGFLDIGGTAMMASATDEAEHAQENSPVQNFNNGSWNSINNPNNVWASYYRGIRRANFFLESIGKVNLDLYKLDPSISQQSIYRTRLFEMERWKYEARFLRAFFYFELVKRYGGVPIINQTLGLEDIADVKRNTLQECIDFIKSECDSVATVMIPGIDVNRTPGLIPVSYGTSAAELGRVTRGAALALKSKVLLYAASELFNNPSWAGAYSNKELISLSGESRTQRWQAASDAALAVITAYGATTLTISYNNLFNAGSLSQTEMIFIRRNTASNSFEQANFPIGLQGRSGTNPS